jgi:hypothetical protein
MASQMPLSLSKDRSPDEARSSGASSCKKKGGSSPVIGMSPSKAEWYRGCAEDCCRKAIMAEDITRRLHWLEAAARWVSFARQEGVWPPRQPSQDTDR